MSVNLDSYIFPIIEYDPTENPRGIVTADEWNTIMNLLKESANYASRTLQEVFADLYTASELSSDLLGQDGARLIGIDYIEGLNNAKNVNEAIRELKLQLQSVTLGNIPDGSITSEKLAPDLNFTGDTVTFNNKKILTIEDITGDITENSTDDEIPGAATVFELFNTKQDKITIGTAEPNANTAGTIYLQYIV